MYHNVLHGFWDVRGAGTAAIDAKLIEQLTATREAVLLEVFLDLQKAYNALDQNRSLELLAAYGVGPRTL